MRAVLLKGHGGPEQLEYREDLPPPAPAPGEVLIQVGAAGINNTDVNLRIGWYSANGGWTGSPVRFPLIQGADGCGRIVAVGDGVEPSRIGQRVLLDPILRSGRRSGTGSAPDYLGSDRDGTFAEFTAVPAPNACPIRSSLTDAELASFPCSYGAAENMLTRAALRSGECVLITGASGGVGSAAVQLARRRGATVVAVAGHAKARDVQALGASAVLDRNSDLTTILGRESVDVVVDVAGGAAFPQLLEVLRRRGRYATAGAIAGPAVELDLRTLYLKDLTLHGCTELDVGVFGSLIGYIERSEIRPLLGATYALRDIAAAQQAFLEKTHVGKIVLIM